MNENLSEQGRWRAVLAQQQMMNARRWLAQLETAVDLPRLVMDEYDNLLRALEIPVENTQTFSLLFAIMQRIHSVVVGQADWERWLAYCQRAVSWAKKLSCLPEESQLLEQISDLYFLNGNYSAAEDFCRQSLALRKKLGQQAEYGSSLLRIAVIYDRQGRTAEAILLCKEAIELASFVPASDTEAKAYLILAGIYLHAQDVLKSLQYGRKAFALFLRRENVAMASRSLLPIMACLGELGEWGEAEEIAEDLARCFATQGDIFNLSQLKNNFGLVAFQKGEFLMAEAAWQEALRLHSQMQHPAEVAAVYNNLGMVYTRLAEWEEAEQMLQSALRLYDNLGDLFNWANTMDNLADLHEARGETAVLRQTLLAALDRTKTEAENPQLANLRQAMQERLTPFIDKL